MTERVVIDFDEQGNPTLDVLGATGPGCKKLTEDWERALGETVADRPKPEYRQREQSQQQRH